MNTIKFVAACALCACANTAFSQHDHSRHTGPSASAAATTPSAPWVEGELVKVDAAARLVTLRHAAIPNLDMPAMTMVFAIAPMLVGQAAAGDLVRFTAETVQGEIAVTALEKRSP